MAAPGGFGVGALAPGRNLLDALIRRVVVHDERVEILTGLAQHSIEAFQRVAPAVPADEDDGDGGSHWPVMMPIHICPPDDSPTRNSCRRRSPVPQPARWQ